MKRTDLPDGWVIDSSPHDEEIVKQKIIYRLHKEIAVYLEQAHLNPIKYNWFHSGGFEITVLNRDHATFYRKMNPNMGILQKVAVTHANLFKRGLLLYHSPVFSPDYGKSVDLIVKQYVKSNIKKLVGMDQDCDFIDEVIISHAVFMKKPEDYEKESVKVQIRDLKNDVLFHEREIEQLHQEIFERENLIKGFDNKPGKGKGHLRLIK